MYENTLDSIMIMGRLWIKKIVYDLMVLFSGSHTHTHGEVILSKLLELILNSKYVHYVSLCKDNESRKCRILYMTSVRSLSKIVNYLNNLSLLKSRQEHVFYFTNKIQSILFRCVFMCALCVWILILQIHLIDLDLR